MNKSQKIQTLKENHLFSKAYRKGRCFSGKYIAVYVLKNYDKNQTKLGITVSKSRGNAVKRNRTKRVIRDAYRVFHPFIKEGFIIVIVARQPCVTAPVSVVTSELEGLLSKAALL
jgi:ribonuclease P protein component